MAVIPVGRPEDLSWSAQEVVKEVDNRPHLLVRIAIRGLLFPHRALVPFLRIVSDRGPGIDCWFSEESADGRSLAGYFHTELPPRGTIEFGYGNQVMGRVAAAFEANTIRRLDRRRLPLETIVVTSDYLRLKLQPSSRPLPR